MFNIVFVSILTFDQGIKLGPEMFNTWQFFENLNALYFDTIALFIGFGLLFCLSINVFSKVVRKKNS